MRKYRIIGNMTGNSMDAVDLVLTEFAGNKMTDVCSYSRPYTAEMQTRMADLRRRVFGKTKEEIEQLPEFTALHDAYVTHIAACIREMCALNGIDMSTIDAIGFHGKTLDHHPPSKAQKDGSEAYTLQIGSGQMLADLTGIKTVYDFRSDFIMAGFEGAPLIVPHNARMAAMEGDGCYYNGGNTANFALICNGQAVFGTDAGPFNEYTDNFMRQVYGQPFDADGQVGQQGRLDEKLLQFLFDCGREFYETGLPKSGDPAYYHQEQIFEYVRRQAIPFCDTVRTFEYFAAYIAVQALTLVPQNINYSPAFILFGGGWKNPLVQSDFKSLLAGKGFVLPEHREAFAALCARLGHSVSVRYSQFGAYMEARLLADLAYCRLQGQSWRLPETEAAGKQIVCGVVAEPGVPQPYYEDRINRAAKGKAV